MSTDFVRYTRSPKSFDLVLKSRPFFTYAAKHFEKGDALAVNSWRVTPEHPLLGEIMKLRRIYAASAKVRQTLKHQPQTEPNSADEVLA